MKKEGHGPCLLEKAYKQKQKQLNGLDKPAHQT